MKLTRFAPAVLPRCLRQLLKFAKNLTNLVRFHLKKEWLAESALVLSAPLRYARTVKKLCSMSAKTDLYSTQRRLYFNG